MKTSNKNEIRNLIREYILLELENAPERKTNDISLLSEDSFDLAVDRSIGNFEKDAKGKEKELDLDKFVSGIHSFSEHIQDQIDLKGILLRRVANYITKSYDEATSKEVLRLLEDTFGLSTDSSFHASEPSLNNVPIAKNGYPDASGGGGPG